MSDDTLDVVEPTAQPAPPATQPPPPPASQPAPPSDWRKDYVNNLKTTAKDPTAIDEAKVLKRLERYQSPHAIIDAQLQIQERFGRGEIKSQLPKDAKPEDVARWRAENGLPEKPEAYVPEILAGAKLDEGDAAVIEGLKKVAYEQNMHPAQFNAAVKFMHEVAQQKAEKRAEADIADTRALEDHFREQWGPDYRRNRAVIDAYLESGPEGLREALFNARGPDGKRLGSNIGLLSFLTDRAREVMDVNTILPADASTQANSITDDLMKLRSLMGNTGSEYWKGPKAESMQARYRELIEAEAKMKARGLIR